MKEKIKNVLVNFINKRKIVLIIKNLTITVGLFLLISILFFLVENITGTDILTGLDLKDHLVEIVLGILAAGLVLSQLEAEAELEESQFILEQNKVFIEDETLREVEKYLEVKVKEQRTGTSLEEPNLDGQSPINYLVYLEGLASEEQLGVISLKEIDNVFSYRYFSALNCLKVQQNEIKDNMSFYLSCIRLYNKWYDFRVNKCKSFCGENEMDRCIPLYTTPLFYMPDFEKYLDKPVLTEVNGEEIEAKIFGVKVGWITQNEDNEIQIKPRPFIKKETKTNVERALLKGLIRKSKKDENLPFEKEKDRQEYLKILEYSKKYAEY